MLNASVAEGQKHLLALEELTQAEKSHGSISRAQDADPSMARVREAVAKEAQTYASPSKEGAGQGVRYTAFDRYTKLAQQGLERMRASQAGMVDLRAKLKPLDPTEAQLRRFHEAYDAVPWADVEITLHSPKFERPAAVAYSDFVDRAASAQEDLLIALEELFAAPTSRHIFAFALALFIDVIVFLLAFA